MRKLLKFAVILLTAGLAAGLIFSLAGCGDSGGDEPTAKDNIKWTNEPNGTLNVTNSTQKDMVLFQGQTPSISNIIGGVKAGVSKDFDISDDVTDFGVGGYMVLRGVTLDEYNANKSNLSLAKIEYSAMATYGQGKKFRTEIYPNYMGDYGYRVTNIGRLGIELRKGSPDGEKVGYLSSLASNVLLYSDSTSGFALYPVYVYFNRTNGQVTTLRPTTMFDTITVSPRGLANASQIQSYLFPADQNATWENIKSTLTSPVAYVTLTNSVGTGQSGRVTISGGNRLNSQNGYDTIGIGETLTYEIPSTVAGTQQNLVLLYYEGALQVPVTVNGITPTLKNGYDYTISITGSGQTAAGYSITFTESATARDLSNQIESL